MNRLFFSLVRYLGSCARIAVERERPQVIAITGSVGKSTTRQLIGAVLEASAHYREGLRVPTKNYNNELGVPLTVFGVSAPGRSVFAWGRILAKATWRRFGAGKIGARTLVLEMGADHPGDLAYLTAIARPTVSVVTAVTPERTDWAPVHAANYPTIDALAEEKSTLVRALATNGIMVLNADDARVIAMQKKAPNARLITFGACEAADVRVLSTRIRMKSTPAGSLPVGLEVTIGMKEGVYAVYLQGVFGTSVAYALAASAAVGRALDISIEELQEGWRGFAPLSGRARLIPGIKGTMLLDDSYNASPVAVLAALRDLASLQVDEGRQRKIACLGEMRELGKQSAMLHEEMGFQAAQLGIDILAVTGAQADAYVRGAKRGGMQETAIQQFEDTPELGAWVQDILRSGDIVLAKASEGAHTTKGVRMERVIKELMAEPARAEELLCRQEAVWQTRR